MMRFEFLTFEPSTVAASKRAKTRKKAKEGQQERLALWYYTVSIQTGGKTTCKNNQNNQQISINNQPRDEPTNHHQAGRGQQEGALPKRDEVSN